MVERCLTQYENEVSACAGGSARRALFMATRTITICWSAPPDIQPRQAVSVIDFGDMLLSKVVCEPAIAAAYALLGKRDPLAAAAQVVAGYHSAFPLTEAEIALLFPLIRARLAVSVTNSAQRKLAEPDDPYITISEAPAWAALAQLDAIHPRFAHYTFRHACGLPPVPHSAAVAAWLQANTASFAPVLGVDLRAAPSRVFDLSVGSLFLGADPSAAATPVLSERIFRELRAAGVSRGGWPLRRGAADLRHAGLCIRRAPDRRAPHDPSRASICLSRPARQCMRRWLARCTWPSITPRGWITARW